MGSRYFCCLGCGGLGCVDPCDHDIGLYHAMSTGITIYSITIYNLQFTNLLATEAGWSWFVWDYKRGISCLSVLIDPVPSVQVASLCSCTHTCTSSGRTDNTCSIPIFLTRETGPYTLTATFL